MNDSKKIGEKIPKQLVICQQPQDTLEQSNIDQLKSIELFVNHDNSYSDYKEYISTFLQKINRVEELIFQVNFLEKIQTRILNQIFQGVRQFKQLMSFTVTLHDKVQFDHATINILGESLGQLTQLKQLAIIIEKSFYNNEILLQSLLNLTNLNELELEFGNDKQINYKELKLLTNAFKVMLSLTKLSISIGRNNDIRAFGAQQIGSSLKCCKNLKELKIQINKDNFINLEGLKSICQGLSSLKLLDIFEFILEEDINNDMIALLSKSLSQMQKLQKIGILIRSSYTYPTQFFKLLEDGLKKHNKLFDLKINLETANSQDRNKLWGIDSLLKKLSTVKNIQLKIEFTENEFELEFSSVYEGIGQLNKIERLNIIIPEDTISGEQDILFMNNQFRKLEQLEYLSIQFRKQEKITTESGQHLFEFISYLTNLKEFKIKLDRIGKQSLDATGLLTSLLKYLKKLQTLQIEVENCICENTIKQLTDNIKNLVYLSSLQIQFTNLNSLQIKKLFQQLQNLHSLKDLNLSLSNVDTIQSDCLESLAQPFNSLQHLSILKLSLECNQFSYQIAQNLNKYISQLKYLKQLTIQIKSDNSYSLEHQIGMVVSICLLNELTLVDVTLVGKYTLKCSIFLLHKSFLYFQKNNTYFCFFKDSQQLLDPQDFKIKTEITQQLQQIDYFYWNNNCNAFLNFTKDSITSFKDIVSSLKCLNGINITIKQNKMIDDDIIKQIFESISNKPSLKNIKISFNLDGDQMSRDSCETIQRALSQMPKLQYIDININRKNRVEMSQMMIILSDLQSMKNLISAKIYYKCGSFIDFSMYRSFSSDNIMRDESDEGILKKFTTNLTFKITKDLVNQGLKNDKFMEYLVNIQFDKLVLEIEECNITNQQYSTLAQVIENQQYISQLDIKTYPQNIFGSNAFLYLLKSIFSRRTLKEFSFIVNSKKLILSDIFIFISFLTQNSEFCNNLSQMNYMITTLRYAFYKQSFKVDQFLQITCQDQLYIVTTLRGNEELQEIDFQQLSDGLQKFQGMESLRLNIDYNVTSSNQDFWKHITYSNCFTNLEKLRLNINQKSLSFSDIFDSFVKFLSYFENLRNIKIFMKEQSQIIDRIKYENTLNAISNMKMITNLTLELDQKIYLNNDIVKIFSDYIIRLDNLRKVKLNLKIEDVDVLECKTLIMKLKELKAIKQMKIHISSINNLQLSDIEIFNSIKSNQDQIFNLQLIGNDVEFNYRLNYNQTFATNQMSIQLELREFIDVIFKCNYSDENIGNIFKYFGEGIKSIVYVNSQNLFKHFSLQSIMQITKSMNSYYKMKNNHSPDITILQIKSQLDIDLLSKNIQYLQRVQSLSLEISQFNLLQKPYLIQIAQQSKQLEQTSTLKLKLDQYSLTEFKGQQQLFYKQMKRLVQLKIL